MSDLELHTCAECGIHYAAPPTFWKQRRSDGRTFFCPNGHERHYRQGESEADKLRRERDRLAQRVAEKDAEIEAQRDRARSAERREAAQKANVTKLKKRAGAGVCPCCNRTFSALQKHMQSQHPEFTCEAA